MDQSDELITELPLGFPGSVYRSRMPFSNIYDPAGSLINIYLEKGINAVVLLETRENYLKNSGKDLDEVYSELGLEVLPFPIGDFGIPDQGELREVIDLCLKKAIAGENIVIHCHAGIGRTGMFAACLAKRALGLSGEEALNWIRQVVPGSVETPGQVEIVRNF